MNKSIINEITRMREIIGLKPLIVEQSIVGKILSGLKQYEFQVIDAVKNKLGKSISKIEDLTLDDFRVITKDKALPLFKKQFLEGIEKSIKLNPNAYASKTSQEIKDILAQKGIDPKVAGIYMGFFNKKHNVVPKGYVPKSTRVSVDKKIVTPENIGEFLSTKQSAYPTLFKKGFLGFGFKNPSAIKGLKDELLLKFQGKTINEMIDKMDTIITKHQDSLKKGLGEEGQREVNTLWKNTKEAFNPYRKNILTGKAEVDPAFLKNLIIGSTILTSIYFLLKHKGNVGKAATDVGIDTGKDMYKQLESAFGGEQQNTGGGKTIIGYKNGKPVYGN